MRVEEFLSDDHRYVLCICEGTAEMEIIEYLLEHDKLIFSKQELLNEKPIRRCPVKKIEERFLSYTFEKPLIIVRIIDSKNEKFSLSKQYKERFQDRVITVYTRPEIEILYIIQQGHYHKYKKTYATMKPSEYCRVKFGIKKAAGSIVEIFSNIEELIDTLKEYKRLKHGSEPTIADLLKP